MVKPVGGRGHRSVETTHVRIPVPIKAKVQALVDEFHSGSIEPVNSFPTVEQAASEAQRILLSKKSARVSLEKLLTAIYGTEISL